MLLMGMLALVTTLLPASDPGWRWPLWPAPQVLRGFDPPAHPWEAGHRGVDLAATPGQRVHAAGAGRVTFARDLAGRGVVTIDHGRLRTTYLPVRPSVRPGRLVSAGARIGVIENVLGHCGQSTCLHWGLRDGATYLDPLTLLGQAPVRLLPWWNGATSTSPAPTDPPIPSLPYEAAPPPTVYGTAPPPAAPPPTAPQDAPPPPAAPPPAAPYGVPPPPAAP